MIKEAIIKIVNKEDLTYDEAYTVMNEIMSGQTSQTQNAAFLAALSTKSTNAETTDEIAGCAAAMREQATSVETGMETLEIVGTGGDGAHSFNISTTAAMIIAAAGVKVTKHGNRAASSLSGTADCLEALGVNIQEDPDKCIELLNKVGICFLFAQKYHSSMKYVGAIRRELGFRTVFNILGPLTNPAKPSMMILGVYDGALVEPLAKVLSSLGVKRGMVVYGTDKLDEISIIYLGADYLYPGLEPWLRIRFSCFEFFESFLEFVNDEVLRSYVRSQAEYVELVSRDGRIVELAEVSDRSYEFAYLVVLSDSLADGGV